MEKFTVFSRVRMPRVLAGVLGGLFIIISLVILVIVYRNLEARSLQEAQVRARSIIDKNDYILDYLSDKSLHTGKNNGAMLTPIEAVTNIDGLFQALSPHKYIYRVFKSGSPRTGNLAESNMSMVLDRFIANPGKKMDEGIVVVSGEKWYYRLVRSPHLPADNLIVFMLPLAPALKSSAGFALRLAGIIILIMLAVITLSLFIINRLVFRPIRRLTMQADRISGSDQYLGQLLDLPIGYELSSMAYSFNRMSLSLKVQKENLEELVDRRTRELAELNAELKQRVDAAVSELRNRDQQILVQSRHSAMGEMLSLVAHQWKQPLSVISILIQTLDMQVSSGQLDSEKIVSMTRKAENQIEFMDRTLSEFREFLKPGGEKQVFPVCGTVAKVLTLLESTIQETGIRVVTSCRVDPEMDCIRSYPSELFHCVLNIVTNACQIAKERQVAEPVLEIVHEMTGQSHVISFTDNAGGIEDENWDKVFDSYYSSRAGGTGLGLYICRLIVETRLGGTIKAANVSGGACFTITIPVSEC